MLLALNRSFFSSNHVELQAFLVNEIPKLACRRLVMPQPHSPVLKKRITIRFIVVSSVLSLFNDWLYTITLYTYVVYLYIYITYYILYIILNDINHYWIAIIIIAGWVPDGLIMNDYELPVLSLRIPLLYYIPYNVTISLILHH